MAKVDYPTDPFHPYASDGSPVPKQYRDFYAAIILRALSDILETGDYSMPYYWYTRKSGVKQSFGEHSNSIKPRMSALVWIFHSETLNERPSYTLKDCCEVVGIEEVEIQRHAAKLVLWQKLNLVRGDSPNVADNIGRDKIHIDHRVFRKL